MDGVCDKHTLQVYSTPVNVDWLDQALSSHPDKQFVEKLCRELREGARIGYTGPENLGTYPVQTKILRLFRLIFLKEVELGRTVGPSDKRPFPNFQVSPK